MQEPRKTRLLVALGIFAFALLLRAMGLGWGLKNEFHHQSYHPDEADIFLFSQTIEPARFQFTPGFYNYGTLYLTVLRVASDVTSAYTGGFDGKTDESFWTYASKVHLAGRIVSALSGAATAMLLFLMGLRAFGMVGGVAAGLAIAVAPGHVIHSRFQTVDVFATFLLALSAYLALKLIYPDPDRPAKPMQWVALSGLFAGLSAGTKYTGILAVLTLLVAIGFYWKRQATPEQPAPLPWKLALAGLGAAFLGFVIGTPGVLLDSANFLRDFRYEMLHTATGHGLVFEGTSPGFVYHLSNLLVGFGILLALLGLAGLVWAAIRKEPWAFALLAFFLVYYVLIGRAEVKFLRYTFPLYVGVAAGFGYLVAQSQRQENWKRAGIAFAILAIGGVDMGGLAAAAKATAWMTTPDPRDQAAAWLNEQTKNAPQATVGFGLDPWFWSVPVFADATLPRRPMGPHYLTKLQETRSPLLARLAIMAEDSQPPKGMVFLDPADPQAFQAWDVRLLTQPNPPDFVAITSLEDGPLQRLSQRQDLPEPAATAVRHYKDFMVRLSQDYEPARVVFSPAPTVEDIQYVQPRVIVWKRKSPSS